MEVLGPSYIYIRYRDHYYLYSYMSGNYCMALSTELRYFVKYFFVFGVSEYLKNYLVITLCHYQHNNAGFFVCFTVERSGLHVAKYFGYPR